MRDIVTRRGDPRADQEVAVSNQDLPEPQFHNLRLGAALREARRASGLTRGQVEELTAGVVKASTLSAYERCIRVAPERRLALLAEVYGMTSDQLLEPVRREASPDAGLVIDLRTLSSAPEPELRQVVDQIVEWGRQASPRLLAIRTSDLEAITTVEPFDSMVERLRAEGVVVGHTDAEPGGS
jgi:transcriptional regulator with XRE-family HTH domain